MLALKSENLTIKKWTKLLNKMVSCISILFSNFALVKINSMHTDNFFQNLVESYQNQIVFFICYSSLFDLIEQDSEKIPLCVCNSKVNVCNGLYLVPEWIVNQENGPTILTMWLEWPNYVCFYSLLRRFVYHTNLFIPRVNLGMEIWVYGRAFFGAIFD